MPEPAAAAAERNKKDEKASKNKRDLESNPNNNKRAAQAAASAATSVNKPSEYNPRWKGYSYILLSSLINFTAITNIDRSAGVEGSRGVSLSFGIVLFVYSLAVLVTDRLQLGHEALFNYTKACDGKLEGYCLLVASAYSIAGVAYITQVRGIAYLALNVYFSAWFAAAACLYTLCQWSAARDILSVQELTGVSATLKSWYVLFLASMVMMGTSVNMLVSLGNYSNTLENSNFRAAAFGIAFGFCSTVISVWFILTHYNLIECTAEGGWVELFFILVVVLMWIVGAAVLTEYNGIGATIVGTGCQEQPHPEQEVTMLIVGELRDAAARKRAAECALIIQNVTYTCADLWQPVAVVDGQQIQVETIPGSNLYVSVWTCLLASLNLAARWKAQQALQFAQAKQERAQIEGSEKAADDDDDDDDDDDAAELDEFDDADDY